MRNNWVHLITIPLLVAFALGWIADHYVWRTSYTELWQLYANAKSEADCRRMFPDGDPPLSDECSGMLLGKERK